VVHHLHLSAVVYNKSILDTRLACNQLVWLLKNLLCSLSPDKDRQRT
jgi:hypothetical protein